MQLSFPIYVLYPHPEGKASGRRPVALLSRTSGQRLMPVFSDRTLAERFAWSMVEGTVQTSGPSIFPTPVEMSAAQFLLLLQQVREAQIHGVMFDPPGIRRSGQVITCSVSEAIEQLEGHT